MGLVARTSQRQVRTWAELTVGGIYRRDTVDKAAEVAGGNTEAVNGRMEAVGGDHVFGHVGGQ